MRRPGRMTLQGGRWASPSRFEKTPLYDEHLAAGGRMVDFAGFELPVQYAEGDRGTPRGPFGIGRTVRRFPHGRGRSSAARAHWTSYSWCRATTTRR